MNRRRNQLEPPGAGLPWVERSFLDFGLKFSSSWLSKQRALKLFLKDADTIIGLVREQAPETVARKYMIPRMVGIEDSSRNWSVLMVIQHLNMANRAMLEIITALVEDRRPQIDVSIADLKPPEMVDRLVVEDFQLLNQEIEAFVNNQEDLRTEETHPHPWFGELHGHLWLCLAAAHQRIHRRQCRKILTMIGVL